jgi:hypothetical protein
MPGIEEYIYTVYQDEEGYEKLTSKLKESETYWSKTLDELSKKLNCSAKEVVPVQAEVISLRQRLTDQIKDMSYQLFKLMPKINKDKKERFVYYSSPLSKIQNNSTERMRLIEWDISHLEQRKNVFDQHIEFLRETVKNLDNMNFSIKNKITLYQLTDLE